MSETQPQLDKPALNIGDKLSQFQVVEQLGGGGSSIIWKAHDPLLDRYVAIKQLLVSPDQEEAFHARFRKEAALLKQLSEQEPRLVKMIEHIDDERGAFIITEYIDGPSLEKVIAENGEPSGVRGTLRILYALTQGLKTIHNNKVIHRDLKPSNILLPREGGLKICDLGLAALIAEQEALTLGSARYMAPELFRGEQADGRADIYSLGVIIYEMLCGRTQFEKNFKTVVRDQRNQAMRWMKWHTNARLTAPPLKEQNPNVPERLSELVGRMMEKDPAKRVGSAEELEQAIARHFSHQQHGAGATTAGATGTGADAAGDGNDASASAQSGVSSEASAASESTGDTAPLPKRRRWPWAVAGSAAALVLVGAAVMLTVTTTGQNGATVNEQVSKLINDGQKAYNNGNFAEARDNHQQAITLLDGLDRDRPHPLRDNAQAGLLAAKVRLNLQNEQFSEARTNLDDLEKIDEASRQRIQQLNDQLERRASFATAMRQIEQAIENDDLDKAEQRLQRWATMALSDKERNRVEQLRVRVAGQRRQRAIQLVLDDVNRLMNQNQRGAAIQRLERGLERYESARLNERLNELRRQQRIDQLMTEARQAERTGELADAVEKYGQVLEMKNDPALKDRMRRLQAQRVLRKADQLADMGNLAAARDAYNRALGFAAEGSSEYQRAREALSQIEQTTERQQVIAMADKAYERANYDVAIRQYERALQMSDPGQKGSLREKLTSAKAERLVQQGDQALRNDNLEKARQLYQQARSLQQDTTGTSEGLDKVQRRLEYQRHLAEGDKLRKAGKYSQAKLAYRNAREVRNTEEIQNRIEDVNYQYLINKANSYIANEQWEQARSTLLTIQSNVRDTEEVRQKLNEVQKNLSDEA
jgi:serine/threonine-protein kinase